jgi:hypothetical protein
MKSAEDIRDLVKKAAIGSNPAVNSAVLEGLLEELDKCDSTDSAAAQPDLSRRIMKSRMTKPAAAAVIIIALIIGFHRFAGSIDIASTAFAQMTEAMMKVPCVHVLIEAERGQKKYYREQWVCFESGIKGEKYMDGRVTLVDINENKQYVYRPESGKTTVSIYRPGSQPPEQTESSEEFLHQMLKELGMLGAEMTAEKGRYDGMDVDIYRAELPETDYGRGVTMKGQGELVAERQTRLPVHATVQGWGTDGTVLLDGRITFDYPENAPKNIYDLGVPEGVPLVDSEPAGEAEELLNRLERRVQTGFGDLVAVLTESVIKDDEPPRKRAVRLFGQSGESLLYARYLMQTGNEQLSSAFPIEGRPRPDVEEVLEHLHGVVPQIFFVSDGKKGWHGRYDKSSVSHVAATEIVDEQELLSHISVFSLAGGIWPGRHKMDLDKEGVQVTTGLLRDDEHQEQIGLRVDEAFVGGTRHEWLYWIDPGRGDMPVEVIQRGYEGGSPSIDTELHTKYLSYGRIRDYMWYPTRWQMTVTTYSDGRPKHVTTIEYYLRIYPEAELDEGWLTKLIEKVD